jgi:hypothetical protein
MAAWVEKHFSKHAIRFAKNFESCYEATFVPLPSNLQGDYA